MKKMFSAIGKLFQKMGWLLSIIVCVVFATILLRLAAPAILPVLTKFSILIGVGLLVVFAIYALFKLFFEDKINDL